MQTKQKHRLKEHLGHSDLDIQFAQHQQFFAVLDENSSLFIYQVAEDCIPTKHIAILNWPSNSNPKTTHEDQPKISWCPYIPNRAGSEESADDESQEDEEEEECHVLAIYAGRHLHVVNLGILKEHGLFSRDSEGNDVDFETAKGCDGAILSLTLEADAEADVSATRIAGVCIAPDCTAIAVAKNAGPVAFYVIDYEENALKFAHIFDPRAAFTRANATLSDLIFLDDLRAEQRKEAPFWRACVAISHGGRQIALFECQKWRRLGRIRFESPRTVNDFIPIIDPSSQFLHFLDVDGANLYSVEISEAGELPRFAGVTQTSFCNPIYALAHVGAANSFESESQEDDIFQNDEDEDDESDSNSDSKAPKLRRYFVAMGKKSMVELQITLKQHQNLRQLVEITPKTSNATQDLLLKIPAALNSAPQLHENPVVDQKQAEEFGQKLDDIVERLERIEMERKASNERLVEMIGAMDDQMRQREGYLLNRIEQVCENSRLDIIAALRNGNTAIQAAIDPAIRSATADTSEYVAQRVGGAARAGLQECVVPAFERSCDLLFDRLNEQFRAGLAEYLTTTSQAIQNAAVAAIQLAATQVAPANSSSTDRAQLLQLLKNSPELAFETALNTGDPNLLEFVCSHVNPDSLFSHPNSMSQPVLVSLLQQLTLTLGHERDLKYRYIEHILPAINVSDAETMQHTPNVASQLLTTLQEIIKTTQDEQVRRHTRLLFQLTRSTFYQSPHPQRSYISDLHNASQHSPM
ncbi:unnamed protein product [Caenorhabditis angaria]|uniref:Enhancer of mRNA-decapping protein 4 WD40 repeat region domain-containing protein n=1 Tax=Caenorhabditis angaria TaxID=860376 RepID=A0A9P1I829_9PELO|nr:unnamed protein product [Caenorhabditis angaria]